MRRTCQPPVQYGTGTVMSFSVPYGTSAAVPLNPRKTPALKYLHGNLVSCPETPVWCRRKKKKTKISRLHPRGFEPETSRTVQSWNFQNGKMAIKWQQHSSMIRQEFALILLFIAILPSLPCFSGSFPIYIYIYI